jgi:hybrid cluster-associated redox disulfide protein
MIWNPFLRELREIMMSSKQSGERITADSLMQDIVEHYPQSLAVLLRHRLSCAGCVISPFHTVADTAREYTLPVDLLVSDLNRAIGLLQHPRLIREWKTVQAMIGIYCRAHHSPVDGLCPECQALAEYAYQRLQKCPFQENKTTCARCTVHCYKPAMRSQIKVVMRFAGPRIMVRHPVLALLHIMDGRKIDNINL